MVSSRLHTAGHAPRLRGARVLCAVAALLAAALSCRGGGDTGAATNLSTEERAAEAVRTRYTATDQVASAAWTWTSPDSTVFVIVDVQSGVEGVVMGRADLWAVSRDQPAALGRSAPMPSMASLRTFAFEDLTGDGLPDFFGAIADSSETAYPIFLPGAPRGLVDELEIAGTGFVFSLDENNPPSVVKGPGGVGCALQLWAQEPVPDGQPAGWRYLALGRGGRLERPSVTAPACGGAPPEGPSAPGT